MNGPQEAVTVFPPASNARSFVIYSRSKMKYNNSELGLKINDRICVSFTATSQDETIGMLNSLFSSKVCVMAIQDHPLQKSVDNKGDTEFKIRTADSFTVNTDDEEEEANFADENPRKRKK